MTNRKDAGRLKRDLDKANAKNNRLLDLLYLTPLYRPDYDEMSAAVSEACERLEVEETHPVVRAELLTHALQAICREFNVQYEGE